MGRVSVTDESSFAKVFTRRVNYNNDHYRGQRNDHRVHSGERNRAQGKQRTADIPFW
jgi:hypothetical protein